MTTPKKSTAMMMLTALILAALWASGPPAGAQERTGNGSETTAEDLAEMNRLMTILEEHTEIATKSRLNADYVPGMVTVLYGEDLAARGIHTVWEALRLVPGMDLPIENVGGRDILVRGVAENFFSGNTKVLLDGVSMNVLLYAEASLPIQIPIELIDRIEVIRGPGSAIHGEFAYTSVVNIITQDKEHRIFAGLGRFNTFRGGGMIHIDDPQKDLHLSLSAAGTDTDGADVLTGPDILYGMDMAAISNAPGTANEGAEFRSLFLHGDWGSTSFRGTYMETQGGDAFGMTYALPPPDEGEVTQIDQLTLDIRHRLDISPALEVELQLGWMEHGLDFGLLNLYPPGFAGIYTDGFLGGFHYEERRISGGVDLTWKGWDQHTLLLGWSAADTQIGDMWLEANVIPSTLEPIPKIREFRGEMNFLDEETTRTVNSLTLQDEFRISDAFTITAGLRYDYYDDVEASFSPRLAGVWRLTDDHILKAQYARAFRPPTFSEMYSLNNPVLVGNRDLGLSTIDTFEIGYILKRKKSVGRVTTYYSELSDVVLRSDNNSVTDDGGVRVRGFELEIEHTIAAFLRFSGSLSYADADDIRTGGPVEGAPAWLGNAGLMYQPHERMALHLQYRYVGDRSRAADDPRGKLAAYETVDVAGSLFHLGLKGLTLRAGIKNLFEEDIRDPAPMSRDPFDRPIPSYPEDFPRPGREWWATISFDF